MLAPIRRRFLYHAWATARLADALPDVQGEAACSPLAHALTADRVWLLRLRGEPTDGIDLWPVLDASACRSLARRNADAYDDLLDDLDGDGAAIRYANSTGTLYETPVADVLDHVLLHGAHHRGQTSRALREAGISPPPVDFIAWVRLGEPSALGHRARSHSGRPTGCAGGRPAEPR